MALAQSNSTDAGPEPAAVQTSTQTVISALILNAAIFGVEIAIFFLLRARFRVIYEPKSYLGPPEEQCEPQKKSLFGWIIPFLKTPSLSILEKNGLDAYMYLTFLWMMIEMFVPIWIVSWGVLMPIYGYKSGGTQTGFNQFSFANVGKTVQQQQRLAAPFLVQVFATTWILYCIRKTMREFILRRQQFLVSPNVQASAQSRTILVTGIPNELLSERKITELYSHLPGGVVKVWLHRNVKDLPDLVDERAKWCKKLEAAETKVIKTAYKKVDKKKVPEEGKVDVEASEDPIDKYLTTKERPSHRLGKVPCIGKKVDTIQWCREEIARLNKVIGDKRAAVSTDYKKYPPRNAAFILFKTQIAAQFAVNAQAHHLPYRMYERYMGAHPNDIVWSNLNMNPYEKRIRTAIGWAFTLGLVLFWTIPISFVGIFSNISGLAEKVHFLKFLNADSLKVPLGIFQGVLPTIMLAVLNMLLPIVLRLSARLSGIPTKTGIELSFMTRFFLFQIIQNFLFLTLVSGSIANVTGFVQSIAEQPIAFPGMIAEAIPKAATFFLSFIALQGLTGAASGFLRIVPLIVYYVKLVLLGSTPRKVWHINHDMGAVAWGTLFPTTTLITVIALGYMVTAPIVVGFAVATFVLYWLLFKYQFIYVIDQRPEAETAGLFFPKAVNQVFAGLYLEQVMMCALFFVSQSNGNGSNDPATATGPVKQSAIAQGGLMVVLIVATAAFHYFLMDSFGSLSTSLPLTLVTDGFAPEVLGHQLPSNGQALSEKEEKEKKEELVDAVDANSSPSTVGGQDNMDANESQELAHSPADGSSSDTISGTTSGTISGTTSVGGRTYGNDAGLASSSSADENTFLHPSLLDEQKPIWIPDDKFGIGRASVAAARRQGVAATSEQTSVNEKGKVTTNAHVPPGEILD
ncbi:unnamed protein product [Tilletia laevis]|nr:hypothetical protein CF336_g6210 [Tilletia laevis]CAD6892990.1 unnamed protein product [Tilletia caries]CAD6907531.1 unnamed protein product [Tilletia controversa]CAD6921683.1 unnamed protein product [Tilletia caries]CAD6938762.1 unnamed protein product [Tilletia caries]